MATDADLVLCLFFPSDSDTDYDPSLSSSWYLLNSLAYLQGYVRNSQQRAVISMSLNAHSGPHNGKGDVVDALAGLQQLMKGGTGIRQNTADRMDDDVYFTLKGMRITGKPAIRGIYLKGNKKVVVE